MTTPSLVGSVGYKSEMNAWTKVMAMFTAKDWRMDGDGHQKATYSLGKLDRRQYVRLRGTNLAPGVDKETDAAGNPLLDDLAGPNDKSKAFADIWLYSNPIFIAAK